MSESPLRRQWTRKRLALVWFSIRKNTVPDNILLDEIVRLLCNCRVTIYEDTDELGNISYRYKVGSNNKYLGLP